MTAKDLLVGVPAVIGAATAAFAGNQGGVVLALALIAGLGWQLRRCDTKHEAVIAQNQRLILAMVKLVATVNAQAGSELISPASLEEMLQGKPAGKFKARKGPGRRESDRGKKDGEDPAAGGPGDVSS